MNHTHVQSMNANINFLAQKKHEEFRQQNSFPQFYQPEIVLIDDPGNKDNNNQLFKKTNKIFNDDNISLQTLTKNYVSTLRKNVVVGMAKDILSETHFSVPICQIDNHINYHSDRSEIQNQILSDLQKANPSLPVENITNSYYFKCVCELIAKVRSLAVSGQFVRVILFFLSVIMIMVRMTYLYNDVEYKSEDAYDLEEIFQALKWLYSLFVIVWVADIFWYNAILSCASYKSLSTNMFFSLFAKEVLIFATYIYNMLAMPQSENIPKREFVVTVVSFLVLIFAISGHIIHQSVLTQTHKKLILLTKEYKSICC